MMIVDIEESHHGPSDAMHNPSQPFRSYALSWKPCQGDSLNLPDHSLVGRFNSFYDDDDYNESTIPLNEIVSQIPLSIAITIVLPTMEPEDSLSLGDEHLNTIPEKESDKFIKSSIEDHVPIPIDKNLFPKKLNEDECFDPGVDFVLEEIEACLTSDFIPSGIDNDNFDQEGDILLLEKLLNDNPSSPLPPKELNFEELKVIKSNVSTDFEDDYYDSEGDIIYLENLLIKDTILNLPYRCDSQIPSGESKFAASGRFAADVAAFKKVEEITEVEIRTTILLLSVRTSDVFSLFKGSRSRGRACTNWRNNCLMLLKTAQTTWLLKRFKSLWEAINSSFGRVYEDEMIGLQVPLTTSHNWHILSSENTNIKLDEDVLEENWILVANGYVDFKSGRNQGKRSYGDNGRHCTVQQQMKSSSQATGGLKMV
ncbi:hypothetical protein Tco_0970831 [Tanacetum coccineum]